MRPIPHYAYPFLALSVLIVPASSFAGVFLPSPLLPQCFRSTLSRFVPGTATCGLRDIGPTGKRVIYWVPGTWVLAPGLDFSGLPVTGALRVAFMPGTQGIGVPRRLLRRG